MVRLAATTLRQVTDLLALVTDIPGTPPYLVEEGRQIMGDLEEQLPLPRSPEETSGVELSDVEVTRISGFLDLLGGAPSTPPDVARDARDCAAQMWETTDTFRLIDITDAAREQARARTA